MTKTKVAEDLKKEYGRLFITIGEFSKKTGMGKDRARRIVHGLDYIPMGKAKKYFIGDLAERLCEIKEQS